MKRGGCFIIYDFYWLLCEYSGNLLYGNGLWQQWNEYQKVAALRDLLEFAMRGRLKRQGMSRAVSQNNADDGTKNDVYVTMI